MKSFIHLGAVASLAALTLAAVGGDAHAQAAWETVDVYQLPNHRNNHVQSMAVDKAGRVFVAGYSIDLDLPYTFVVRRNSDGGTNWDTVLTFDMPRSSNPSTWCQLAVDPAGQIYLAHGNGQFYLSPNGPDASHWIVRKSADHGDTWNIVDDFTLESEYPSVPTAIASDPAGNIYVLGFGYSSSLTSGATLIRRSTDDGQNWTTLNAPVLYSPVELVATQQGLFAAGFDFFGPGAYSRWLVSRSIDGGASWQTVDKHQFPFGSVPSGLAVDRSGSVFAVGWGLDMDFSHWIVRRSTDGGSTWATVDDYRPSADQGGGASGVATDVAGRVFVVGGRSDYHWMVRSSSDGGASWATSDDFLLAPDHQAGATAVSSDANGRVFVAGWSASPGTPGNPSSTFWVVRELPAPTRQPSLGVTIIGSQIHLSWPTNATNFVLQSATTLANGGDWQDSSLTPTVVVDQNVVTVDTTGPSGFFRLHQP